jgi:hypothetical protein
MDTILENQGSLSELPGDVLNAIILFVHPIYIGRIWTCGCKRLNYTLSKRGGVSKFDWIASTLYKICWPVLVSHLDNLRHITIDIDRKYHYLADKDINLAFLPQSVVKLVLRFDLADECLLHALKGNISQFSHLQSLEVTNVDPRTAPILLSYLQKLPKIQSLSMESNETSALLDISPVPSTLIFFRPSHFLLTNLKGIRLPDSLTYLYSKFSSADALLSSLPPKLLVLRALTVNMKPLTTVQLKTLPQSITALTLASLMQNNEEVAQLSALPPGLLSLTIPEGGLNGTLTLQGIKALPRSLTALDVYILLISAAAAKELPPSIKLLGSRITVHHEAVPLLPRTLQTLKIGTATKAHFANLQHLPPRLTTLQSIGFSEMMAKELGRGLHTLNIGHEDGREILLYDSVIAALPGTLTKLSAWNVFLLESHESWGLLPRSLLDLHLAFFTVPFCDVDNPDFLNATAAKLLPPNLTSINLHNILLNDATWFANLPETLKSASLPIQRCLPDNFLTKIPCQTLQHLKLIAIGRYESPISLGMVIECLPRQLLSLTIEAQVRLSDISNDINITNLKNLPPTLTRIQLPPGPYKATLDKGFSIARIRFPFGLVMIPSSDFDLDYYYRH